jgi:hypothetical protein
MKQKFSIIFVTLMAIAVFISIQIVYGQIGPLQKRESFSLYNNTDYGFQILYPSDWNVIEGDADLGDYVTNIVIFEPSGKQGKHFSGKWFCGEVCIAVAIDNSMLIESTLELYIDELHNNRKSEPGDFNLIEYDAQYKLGDKKGFKISFEHEQGNRDYIQKLAGVPYPDPDASKSLAYLNVLFKTRDKYSDEMLPLANTVIDSFRFTEEK